MEESKESVEKIKFFYDYESEKADAYQKKTGYCLTLFDGHETGNGIMLVVYKDVSELPLYLQNALKRRNPNYVRTRLNDKLGELVVAGEISREVYSSVRWDINLHSAVEEKLQYLSRSPKYTFLDGRIYKNDEIYIEAVNAVVNECMLA